MKTFKEFLNKKVLTPKELAKKHGVSKEHILSQLNDGIKVEHEHSSNAKVAKKIALTHLGEDPNYYKKLKKVETSKSL